jgi:activator of HSP90 ATPase
MSNAAPTRRDFARRAALAVLGAPMLGAVPRRLFAATAEHEEDIHHDAESIHQVVTFSVPPARVYDTLLDPVKFSGVMKFSMVPAAPPAKIAHGAGGEFSLFGGYVSGRHIELVPGKRLVQAWRSGSWDAGHFSVARFELAGSAGGTTLTFDHTGFPKGQAQHLVDGWYANYWNPMKKVFG